MATKALILVLAMTILLVSSIALAALIFEKSISGTVEVIADYSLSIYWQENMTEVTTINFGKVARNDTVYSPNLVILHVGDESGFLNWTCEGKPVELDVMTQWYKNETAVWHDWFGPFSFDPGQSYAVRVKLVTKNALGSYSFTLKYGIFG